MIKTNDLRFDDAYGVVYELGEALDAYHSIGTYYAYGIDSSMSDEEKIRQIDATMEGTNEQ
jgi:hypothetical protein